MISHLRHPTLLEDNDPIPSVGRSNSMGDQDVRLSPEELLQSVKDPLFRLDVYRGEPVIENEDRCIHQDCPGNGNTLSLSAGERDSLLADHGIHACWKFNHLIINLCNSGRLFNLLKRGIGPSEGNIFLNRIGKEKGVLRDIANGYSQYLKRNTMDFNSVKKDRAFWRFYHSSQQMT